MAELLLRGGAAGRGGGRVRSGVRPRRGRGAADRPRGRARVRAAPGVLVDIAGADARTAVQVRGRAAGDRTAGAAAGGPEKGCAFLGGGGGGGGGGQGVF